ncbi:hypothetical protein V5O48_016029 [Marasmius crinis-equi]|uniref:Uncharacterized protein n=1 Tax=Marasmius crinis-equi TaxID=585013 RepID=A0ABR3ESV5_9AGAR
MASTTQGPRPSSDLQTQGQDYARRTSQDPLIPPAVPRIEAPNRSNVSSNTNSAVFSTASNGSDRSARSGWTSGVSLNSNSSASAYGDKTGTKGFGTGNEYEHGDRLNSLPGAYGGSVGMKGFGTGHDYERSPRGSPAASVTSFRSNVSRSNTGDRLAVPSNGNHSDKKRHKLGNKLLGK